MTSTSSYRLAVLFVSFHGAYISCQKLPAKRQTLLFSATITQHVREFCPNAASFTFESASKSEFSTCSNLTQQYVFFPQILKPCVLVKLLEEKSSVPNHLSIVFVSTCKTAEILSEMLTLMELSCVGLHSNLSQRRRSGPCCVVQALH